MSIIPNILFTDTSFYHTPLSSFPFSLTYIKIYLSLSLYCKDITKSKSIILFLIVFCCKNTFDPGSLKFNKTL